MADILIHEADPWAALTFTPAGTSLFQGTPYAVQKATLPSGATVYSGGGPSVQNFNPLAALAAVAAPVAVALGAPVVMNWIGGLANLASSIFPGAAPIIQGVASLFGGNAPPQTPAAPIMGSPAAAYGTTAAIAGSGPGPLGAVDIIPFDETSILGPVFPQAATFAPAAIGGTGMIQLGTQLVTRALPAINAVIPMILQRLPQAAALASAIYATYQGLRAQGQSHATAKKNALAAHGVRLRRRRMRVTNVKALRRAGRRVHGFQKLARKLGALPVAGRGRHVFAHHHPRRRRVYRRGDLSPFMVEDYEDMTDQLEDDGYDPGTFLPANEVYAE